MYSETDILWMQHAIQLAQHAAKNNEVPVGAVLIFGNQIIGEGWNCPISSNDPTSHAEIIALRQGAKNRKNYRLVNSTLYVTLEPCCMCIGALIHARVQRVVFGAHDPKSGSESTFQLAKSSKHNHSLQFEGGLLASQCGSLLQDFFKERRA